MSREKEKILEREGLNVRSYRQAVQHVFLASEKNQNYRDY